MKGKEIKSMKTLNIFQTKYFSKFLGLLFVLLFSISSIAQEDEKVIRKSNNLLSEAQQNLQKDRFTAAEAEYRKAISLNPKSETGKYNLGTAYYGRDKNAEAMYRFKQAAATATNKADKHKAFHNLGNTFMNEKNYQNAVNAYKDALRNNPNDEETRYNLALAKDLLDKNPPAPDEDGEDEADDKKPQEQDSQDKNDDSENQDKDDSDGDKDQEDKGENKEEKKGDEKDGDKEEKPDEPGDQPQEQQPVPGQLSPQQVESLLEAMNNEEKRVQEKMNADKQRGEKMKSSKDW